MNIKYSFILLFITTALLSCTKEYLPKSYNQGINIVPKPLLLVQESGDFILNGSTKFEINGDVNLIAVVDFFKEKLSASTGFELATAKNVAINYIKVQIDTTSTTNKEGYLLSSTSEGVTIRAKTNQGIFYGLTTLMQLLPAEIDKTEMVSSIEWKIPNVTIQDEPRFPWRGFHMDVARHFISVDEIKKNIDVLSALKLNKFHWHLTDDQGWRIEIKKYPKLTSVGATRKEADGSTHQGFYTQAQIKEVVAYAKARFIDVIPEIEMPGHSLAALSAYPNLSCTDGSFSPRIIWGVETDIFCAGKEETFTFLEGIINEILPLFPYQYYHLGGDESPVTRWKTCEHCQKRMKTEGLENEHELQFYFMNRMEQHLISKGKKMIGWDEILEGGVSKSANIMSWRGEEGGIAAANAGNDVIMTPGKWMYLDKYESDHKIDPVSIGGLLPLETVYGYEPIPSEIDPEKAFHVLGAQTTMWSEYIYDERQVEYRMYPRILALAELTWTPKNKKDYKDFERRLNNQLVRLDAKNIEYYIPLPEGPTSNIAFVDSVVLDFHTYRQVAKMVYSVDGSELTINSMTYNEPLVFKENTTLRIASVLPQGKMSTVRVINIYQQALSPAVVLEKSTPGLNTRTALGNFIKIADMTKATPWTDGTIDSLSQVNTTLHWGFVIDTARFRAVEIKGYIDIPEDGVFFFSSNQDQVWIDDQLVINNDGFVKRFSQNDGSKALAKGLHKIKIIYFNNVYGGWASDWNNIEVKIRNSTSEEFSTVTPDFVTQAK